MLREAVRIYSLPTIIIANIIFWLALNIFGAAAITSFVPQRIYSCSNFIFKERPFELKFYRKIKINSFKDKLPIYRYNDSMFDRKRLSNKITEEYLKAFIAETCKAELVHLILAILGFTSMAFVIFKIEPFHTFLVISVLMLCLHSPFIMVQRYNRLRLKKLLSRFKYDKL